MSETMHEIQMDKDSIIRELHPGDKLGIDTLPEQLMKKRTEEGFVFNILLVGETGIGKSTLASSLFKIPLCAPAENHNNTEVKLKSTTYHLRENSVNIALTVIETIGYGDQINREANVKPIIHCIESQFEMYFNEELKIRRLVSLNRDTRIHACLYFICPTGHNLKSLDIFCMKQLHDKVNLIPVIAKSDSLSGDELKRFKMVIRRTIERENIKIYHFPADEEMLEDSNDIIPFAVAGSTEYVPVEGTLRRARIFPWGKVLIENEEHSEFLNLKHALIAMNMEDLREKTNDEFYEKYRENRLIELGLPVSEKDLLLTMTTQELFEKLREKQQKEMVEEEKKLKEKFAAKVKTKDEELKALEDAMNVKYNVMFEKLRNEQDHLNHMKNKLDLDIFAFKREAEKKRKSKGCKKS